MNTEEQPKRVESPAEKIKNLPNQVYVVLRTKRRQVRRETGKAYLIVRGRKARWCAKSQVRYLEQEEATVVAHWITPSTPLNKTVVFFRADNPDDAVQQWESLSLEDRKPSRFFAKYAVMWAFAQDIEDCPATLPKDWVRRIDESRPTYSELLFG